MDFVVNEILNARDIFFFTFENFKIYLETYILNFVFNVQLSNTKIARVKNSGKKIIVSLKKCSIHTKFKL